MTTGLSYDGSVAGTNSYVTQIATMAVVDAADPAYLIILPQMITYAENRIYRDLDFLFTSIATTAYGLTAGSRQISVPAGTIVVPEQINVLFFIYEPGNSGADIGDHDYPNAGILEYYRLVIFVTPFRCYPTIGCQT